MRDLSKGSSRLREVVCALDEGLELPVVRKEFDLGGTVLLERSINVKVYDIVEYLILDRINYVGFVSLFDVCFVIM